MCGSPQLDSNSSSPQSDTRALAASLDRDWCFDRGMGIVIEQSKVLEAKIFEAADVRVKLHSRQGSKFTRELFASLLEMVLIEMEVAESVDEITSPQVANLGYHHREQCIGGDIERYTQKKIGAALVQLATEFAFIHIKLKEHVARR